MRKSNALFVIGIGVMLMLNACSPVYKCGETIPAKKPNGKRLRAVVEERDMLCNKLNKEQTEKANLNKRLADSNEQNAALSKSLSALQGQHTELQKNHTELQDRHSKLTNESLSKAAQFNATLKQKSEELQNKERILSEREKALREMQQVIARQDSITKRLNNIVKNALLGFNADELSVEIKNGKVYVSMSDKLLFRSGSANVETKGRDALKVLGDVLNKNPEIDVLVEGHTDSIPIRTNQFKDNWDLSVVRATSIVRILTIDLGLPPTRVTASGKGEFMPRATNTTAEGRALNRRTEIILSPKLDELMQMLQSK